MIRILFAILFTLSGFAVNAQTPNGYINAPIYATGIIPVAGGTTVSTNIKANANHPTNLTIYNTGAITTWNITLPNPPFDGQILYFSCGATVASISIVTTDGSSVDPSTNTSCGANIGFTLQYIPQTNIWTNITSVSTAPIFSNTFCPANQWITALAGIPFCSQPAFSNISGQIVEAQIADDAVTNGKIAPFTIANARLNQVPANTVKANATGSVAVIADFAMPSCSGSGQALHWTTNTGFTCNSAVGSVTSVAASFTGGLISIGGSPITSTGTFAFTVAGTSGGIPYFSSTSTWASSAILAANQLMVGGGAGAAPATLGSLGTTTTVLHGNAAGLPSIAALNLATDVTGTLPVANGGTGLTSGTSGGVLAFTAAGTLASSAALTADLPVIGGGAGVAPSVGTRSGNTTQFVTTTGAQTPGDCVRIDANGNHVANGSACGGGGGGSSKVAQGRLTLTTATPVLTSNVTGATTVYFTPYNGDIVPVWNGSSFTDTTFTELSQATTDSTKSPAAVGASSNYDVFVWDDGGTLRATRGPAWSSATARSTGAGTTELAVVQGIKVNAVAITNGPGAGAGTYVGTIRSNASSTIDFIFGGSGAGGVAAVLNVWNNFNRVHVGTMVVDSGASYAAYTTAAFRQARASSGNQINFVIGISEDAVDASYTSAEQTAATINSYCRIGIGVDSTTTVSGPSAVAFTPSAAALTFSLATKAVVYPGIGSHYIAALESADGSTACTYNQQINQTLSAVIQM